jgi:amino acid adenylation domain-containing protein
VNMCVHDLVSAQATATPDAVAIVAGDRCLSYGELNARANQLSHLLRSHGVGPDVPVGLCMDRSVDLAIAALAILKAGGAYVPLDPTYPSNRLAALLEDSGTFLLVTQPDISQQLPAGKWRTIILDADGLTTADYPSTDYPSTSPVEETKPENLAYIIFTSGSTGRPKGVQITHASLLNLVSWHRHAFNVVRSDHATLQSSPGFDAAVWELWPYLAAGATVHVVDEAVRTIPERLRDWMVRNGITISFLPTVLAEGMIDLPWPPETALRTLLTGADTLRRYPRRDLPFALVNNYGPTECTVVATSATIYPGESCDQLPSIGRPIENTQVYIVDEELKPVPAGAAGELLIGGVGVARGYLGAPELTCQKFVPDPFSDGTAARLYRTGDLGRFLPDGRIAFMGRMDEQIKIRGYRIEPQEISGVLDRHPQVQASCVSAYSDHLQEKRLVAYVVPATEARLSPTELRKFVGQYVPDYMVPSTFVRMAQLPLSPHGKLDRAALPEPSAVNVLDDDSFETPQSQIEKSLAVFLTSLLGVVRVGKYDNFFELGGHSLMGAQLIAKISNTFGVELSLRSLFDHPTVGEVSAEIERLIHAKLASMSEEEAERMLESSQEGVQL